MSVDVRSYWVPAALTPMGLVQYGPDEVVLYATSASADGVDVDCGGSTSDPRQTFRGGQAMVTSHRVVWVQQQQQAQGAPHAFALPLDAVERAELNSGLARAFGFSTPKIILHLHDPNTLEWKRQQLAQVHAEAASRMGSAAAASSASSFTAAPARSLLPRYTRLVFRAEHPATFLQHLQSSLNAGAWRHAPLSSRDASGGAGGGAAGALLPARRSSDDFTTARAGISGIEREAKKRERAIDRTLEQAFSDLNALMSNARTIVALSARMLASQSASASGGGRGELGSQASQSEFSAMMSDMGISNPVTRDMAGSEYHVQLARQMADFLPPLLQREGGMLLLPDVYCLVNRARGTQLISPLDCLTACSLFSQLGSLTTLRLKEFPQSGVKAVVADADTERSIADRLRDVLLQEEREASTQQQRNGGNAVATTVAGAQSAGAASSSSLSASSAITSDSSSSSAALPPWTPGSPYVSLSVLRLSNLWRISLVLARQYLCVGEELEVLCRDESAQGLSFALNRFAQWT